MPETKIRNPFLHSHDHDHDHDHAHGDGHHHDHFEPQDPAQQSLADALRVSFFVLKVIMVALLVAYLFTGIFRVQEQERAVRLRFGAIVGDEGQQVYGPGWHIGLPYPIEQKIIVPVNSQTLRLDRAFWFEMPAGSAGQTLDEMQGGPLNPERDGSLLTGDANIVHALFQVSYRITDPAAFVTNVGEQGLAERIVRNAAEQAIVYGVAGADADAIINGTLSTAAAEGRLQDALDAMGTGITIQTFTMSRSTMPLPVRSSYQAVINAESERGRLIEEARQERTSILNETAGEAYEPLLGMIQAYEIARAAGQEEEAEQMIEQIDEAFESLVVTAESGPVQIAGESATVINRARTARTEVVQRIRGDAERFAQLLNEFRSNPQVVMSRLWQNAREGIFSGDVETLYAPTQDLVTITMNRDPEIQRERERARLQQEQEAARQRSQQQQ